MLPMKNLRWLWLLVTLGVLAEGFRVAMFVVPPDAAQGDVQRIFYYHFASWCGMGLFYLINLLGSVAYLAWRNSKPATALKADSLAVTSAEIGVVFCTIGLVTGSLWGRAVWGIWWTWDPRLTSTFVLWLIYIAYLLLRRLAAGPQMRTLAAVMAIFGYVDVPIVYMSTRWWRTQHPQPVFFGGPNSGIASSMMPAVWWNMAGWLMWGIWVASLRYQSIHNEQLAEEEAARQSLEAAR
ncbi:putative heme exporter protein C [Acidobacterium capsulatum ATCC 51196]|uniref:Heme exporter protein C n=2 Tax=Acidobacteriaceae TaxID=204434 RepID=C1F364_ACIC5|nr:putative heme exporter protein C [Acidobacterium capsulatum ATCC 51196]